jgi:hypothetical protein
LVGETHFGGISFSAEDSELFLKDLKKFENSFGTADSKMESLQISFFYRRQLELMRTLPADV